MKFLKTLFLGVALLGAVTADEREGDADDEKAASRKYQGGAAKQRLLDCNDVDRKFKLNSDSTSIKVEVESDDDNHKSEKNRKGYKCDSDLDVSLKLSGDDGARTKFSLRAQNGDAKTRFNFDFKIWEVVEFVDSGAPGLDANDTVVQRYTLGAGYHAQGDKPPKQDEPGFETWEPIAKMDVKQNDASSRFTLDGNCTEWLVGTQEKTFGIVGRYCAQKGVTFTKNAAGTEWVNKYNVTKNVTLSYKLNPNIIKFDYLVNHFKYKNNNTKLAISGKMKTKTSFKIRHVGRIVNRAGMDELDLNSGRAGFSWATKVFADGVSVPVIKTDGSKDITGDDEENTYYFTFDKVGKVDNFIWDPEMVGDFGGVDQANSGFAVAPGLVTLFAVALATFYN